jgi:hypothetical protein
MAAGLGFKTFTTGEVLTAADTNGYLMQGINVFASTAARDAAITSPQEGQFAFTKDTNGLWYYDGAAWVASGATGDIEGVTAGVGISGGGTSGTVTVTNSMATAIDAKGDLVAGTGADAFARLAVGSNGTVLTADSAEATGLKWAAAAGGMSWVSVLARTSMGTGTSYTASGLSGYNQLMIFIAPLSNNGTTGKYTITFNSDTGTNYFFFGGGGQSGFPTTVGAGNRFMTDGATGTTSVDFCDVPPGASLDVAGAIHILGANTTGIKTGYVHSGMEQTTNTTASLYNRNLGFRYIGTSVISSVTITATAGNFDAGFITIIGSVN